ncbi:MAG: class I SAM-dependent methyltransferase [Cytophagales bacterium]|nr:class I SAM-dependent methyltransferase [Cytophagales bacterium]
MDYSAVTEIPGSRATQEQLARLYQRYHLGARHSQEKRVLEVACGTGIGLGYLREKAVSVVGGDYTFSLLRQAYSTYHGEMPLVQLDAHQLPFSSGSFDFILILEALYYLQNPEQFLQECRRILFTNGKLLIGTVNKEWKGFLTSPKSVGYYSAVELRNLLDAAGFGDIQILVGFEDSSDGSGQRVKLWLRSLASRLNLIPGSLKGRETLKRIFYGPLASLPDRLTKDMVSYPPIKPIEQAKDVGHYQVLYVLATTK